MTTENEMRTQETSVAEKLQWVSPQVVALDVPDINSGILLAVTEALHVGISTISGNVS